MRQALAQLCWQPARLLATCASRQASGCAAGSFAKARTWSIIPLESADIDRASCHHAYTPEQPTITSTRLAADL